MPHLHVPILAEDLAEIKIAAARAGLPLKEWVNRALAQVIYDLKPSAPLPTPKLRLKEPAAAGDAEGVHDLKYVSLESE